MIIKDNYKSRFSKSKKKRRKLLINWHKKWLLSRYIILLMDMLIMVKLKEIKFWIILKEKLLIMKVKKLKLDINMLKK